jgi:PAS domain S-box-containing protein
MEDWKPAFEALSALEAVKELTADPRPAWVFSRDGRSVFWANPSGGAKFGARRFADLAGKIAPGGDPFARQLANVARSLGEGGSLARLRLTSGARAVPLLCQCRPVRTIDGQRGILVIAMDAPTPDVTASGEEAAAFVFGIESTPASAPPSAVDTVDDDANDHGPGEKPAPDGAMEARGLAETQRMPPPDAPLTLQEDEPERFSRALLADNEPPLESTYDATDVREPGLQGSVRSASPTGFPRKPVRFLWQTDAADRILFVSPGLGQIVGRTSEVVGETWHDVASRLKLDPDGRIAEALARHDTWSGLTAWWPVEDSDYRIPAELTALPVFGIDQSFQGFRGFGVLKPGDIVTPDVFRDRYGSVNYEPSSDISSPDGDELKLSGSEFIEQDGSKTADNPVSDSSHDILADHRGGDGLSGRAGADIGPEEVTDPAATEGNVVPLHAADRDNPDFAMLSPNEESAFDEIAAALASEDAAPTDVDKAGARGESDGTDDTRADAHEPAEPETEEPGAEEAADDESVVDESRHDEAGGDVRADSRSLAGRLAEADARIRELTSILDTATDGVLVVDEDGSIERVNASGEALFGVGQADLVGRPLADLLDAESRQVAIDYLSGLKENGVASVLNEGREVKACAGDGTIPLFMTMGRIGSGEKGRFCAVLRDLTHWKQAEAELVAARQNAETASSQKSDFLARVSHEIRTPLNAIIGFSDVMIEERFGPIENERYREYLRDMRTSGEHVVSLVNDLLDISKIEAGKLDLDFDAVPLNALVRECITLMQPQANRAHVILRSSLAPDVPGVVADQRTLRQIVLNLLSNSVKFTGPGGQVIASTAILDNGEAVLKVRDTGVGMSDEELERALEPFRQLTTASFGDGTGLGLPLTKALVEANRADFSIRSARGEGTIVSVAFPPTRVLSE